MYRNLYEFYRSDEWEKFRKAVIMERTRDDGFVYDEETGKPIVRKYDIILHHKIELKEENVRDAMIALNPENIEIVSHRTHNILHDKLGMHGRQVYLVYGSPLSGKTTWVSESKNADDMVVDIDNIWQCVTGGNRYEKPARLKAVVFKIRDGLYDCVKYRLGKWKNAYICGGFALQSERERLARELGAREVFIDETKEECLRRLELCDDGRDHDEWRQYIENWFETYSPPS